MGGHQSAASMSTVWLTPPHVIAALGGSDSFDLDPCGLESSPIRTARETCALLRPVECPPALYGSGPLAPALQPSDGLAQAWGGRVWLNPPYDDAEPWLELAAACGNTSALIFARTETADFHRLIWGKAHGLLFLAGRLHFHHADGTRAKANAGAPSVLVAYGAEEMDRLAACDLAGAFVPLRFARGVMVLGLDAPADDHQADGTWRELVLAEVRKASGPVNLSDLYRAVARTPHARRNPNWRAKVRQTLNRAGVRRVAPATYAA